MGRRSEQKHCINCNMTLPDRYKGRQRIYCSALCRKVYTKEHPKIYNKDLPKDSS